MSKTTLLLLAIVGLSSAFMHTSVASASIGIASGNVLFYQNQGNFCPSGRNCLGAKYSFLEYNTNQPLRYAKVYIVRSSDNAVIGQGVSDYNGFFAISWNNPGDLLGVFAAAIEFRGEHADNRFRLRNSAGGSIAPQRTPFTTTGLFTWVGFPTYGTAGAPNALVNLYDGAEKMWRNSVSQSARMYAAFNNLEIRAFDPIACPTSCANGTNIIIDSAGSAYSPQHRIMHEMGHHASWNAAPRQGFGGSYCYPATGNGCGWSLTSPEWESRGWEEAIATHIGDVALYFPHAVAAFSCLSTGACTTGELEPSGGTSCATDVNREPLTHVRYHWDTYDFNIDQPGEIVSQGVAVTIDTIASFAVGTGERQRSEYQNALATAIDDQDGRCALDFAANQIARFGPNTNLQLNVNCGSAGD